MKVEVVKLESLNLDPNNARRHSARNLKAISDSLEKFGQRKPIVVHGDVVIAGNGTVEAAKALGWDDISITKCPEDWSRETATAYAIADNRSGELGGWDEAILEIQLAQLDECGWDTEDLGFTSKEFEEIRASTENPYTKTVNLPQYEIVGDRPVESDLYNDEKAKELIAEIMRAKLPDDLSAFLILGANRHTVFDYGKIAEYYAHMEPNVQELMESSALVIIDLDDAMRNGYATFVETITELRDGDE